MRTYREPDIHYIAIGSVQDVRHVLRLQQDYYDGPNLCDIPDNLHIYWLLSDMLFARMATPHARIVERGGMEIVEVDRLKLLELQTSLLWLQDTLIEDHNRGLYENEVAEALGIEHYPRTLRDEAERASDIIDVIVDISVDNIVKFVREAA